MLKTSPGMLERSDQVRLFEQLLDKRASALLGLPQIRLLYRIDPLSHLRHASKDIFFEVIDQHIQIHSCAYFFFYPYYTTFPTFFHTITKHTLPLVETVGLAVG